MRGFAHPVVANAPGVEQHAKYGKVPSQPSFPNCGLTDNPGNKLILQSILDNPLKKLIPKLEFFSQVVGLTNGFLPEHKTGIADSASESRKFDRGVNCEAGFFASLLLRPVANWADAKLLETNLRD